MSALRSYLQHVCKAFPDGGPVYARVLLDHGKTFKPNAECRPYMTAKQCYLNATTKSMGDPRYSYAEGIGAHHDISGIPFHHAWLVDAHGHAHDPTWGDTVGNEYFGVVFTAEWRDDFVSRTGYPSVFESLYALRMTPSACYDYVVSGIVK